MVVDSINTIHSVSPDMFVTRSARDLCHYWLGLKVNPALFEWRRTLADFLQLRLAIVLLNDQRHQNNRQWSQSDLEVLMNILLLQTTRGATLLFWDMLLKLESAVRKHRSAWNSSEVFGLCMASSCSFSRSYRLLTEPPFVVPVAGAASRNECRCDNPRVPDKGIALTGRHRQVLRMLLSQD